MSLNDIKLSPTLTTQLFKESLVELSEPIPDKGKKALKKFQVLGNNQKNILLIVNDASSLHLNDTDFQFLTGILNACKLNMSDISLLNIHHYPDSGFDEMVKDISPQQVVLFDTKEITGLKVEFLDYEVVTQKKIQILPAPSLRFISENTDEKKKLWAALKKIFNL